MTLNQRNRTISRNNRFNQRSLREHNEWIKSRAGA